MKVGMIGRGAIGCLYGLQIQKRLQDDFCFIVDERRKERYEEDPICCNGHPMVFSYQTKGHQDLDVIFFATKIGGLLQAIEQVRSFVSSDTILCSLLNGISSEDLLRQAFPDNIVIPSFVQGMDSTYLDNTLTYHTKGELIFGPIQEREYLACDRLEALYQDCSIAYRRVNDILLEQWNKLMFNCGINQTCAAYYTTYGGVQRKGVLQDIFKVAMEECRQVANAQGIALSEEQRDRWMDVLAPMSPEGMPSMRQDILAKRKTELDLFAGTVTQLAKQYGIQTPVLNDLKKRIEDIERSF